MIIDRAKAIELLERAVAEKGADYVYPGAGDVCTYADYDAGIPASPGCLVGHAYFYAGANLGQLAVLDSRPGPSMASVLRNDDLDILPIETTVDAAIIFREAQQWQDSGNSWGQALEAAMRAAA